MKFGVEFFEVEGVFAESGEAREDVGFGEGVKMAGGGFGEVFDGEIMAGLEAVTQLDVFVAVVGEGGVEGFFLEKGAGKRNVGGVKVPEVGGLVGAEFGVGELGSAVFEPVAEAGGRSGGVPGGEAEEGGVFVGGGEGGEVGGEKFSFEGDDVITQEEDEGGGGFLECVVTGVTLSLVSLAEEGEVIKVPSFFPGGEEGGGLVGGAVIYDGDVVFFGWKELAVEHEEGVEEAVGAVVGWDDDVEEVGGGHGFILLNLWEIW